MKRGNIRLGIALLGISFIGLMFVGMLFSQTADVNEDNKVTANAIMISTENSIIVPGMDADLQNKKEGTIMWWTKPEIQIFRKFEDRKEFLIMFNSENLPGLMIAYSFAEKNIVGGTPLMGTDPIEFLDGKSHQIAYTFKKGAQQVLYYDGQMQAMGDYRPTIKDQVTGAVIGVVGSHDFKEAEKDIIDRVEIVDKAMTAEEIQEWMK